MQREQAGKTMARVAGAPLNRAIRQPSRPSHYGSSRIQLGCCVTGRGYAARTGSRQVPSGPVLAVSCRHVDLACGSGAGWPISSRVSAESRASTPVFWLKMVKQKLCKVTRIVCTRISMGGHSTIPGPYQPRDNVRLEAHVNGC